MNGSLDVLGEEVEAILDEHEDKFSVELELVIRHFWDESMETDKTSNFTISK